MKNKKHITDLRIKALEPLASVGFTRKEIATLYGMSNGAFGCFLSYHKLCCGDDPQKEQRAAEMEAMFKSGKTLEEIGINFSVTRERVRQILAKRGVTRTEGGVSFTKELRRVNRWNVRKARKNERCRKFYGCDYDTAIALNDGLNFSHPKCKAKAYTFQRKSALARRVGWEISFPEWCAVWNESGKWEQRGRTKDGYCMARNNDSGSYAVGNVSIQTISQNAKDSYKYKPAAVRHLKFKRDADGLTRREREVWDLVQKGYGASQIGKLLGISPCTVSQHILHARAAFPQMQAA